MKKHFLQVCIVMALLCASLETKGLTLNPFKRSGRVRASSLIVVGNYMEPRLLAEIAQYYSKQPVLVISPDLDGGHQLFFMPTPAKATTDSADQFIEIVKHVNPKRIIVLHRLLTRHALNTPSSPLTAMTGARTTPPWRKSSASAT